MGLSKEAIEEFRDIYYEEFRESISDDEAQEMGQNLISLFEIIYRTLPKSGKQSLSNGNDKDPD